MGNQQLEKCIGRLGTHLEGKNLSTGLASLAKGHPWNSSKAVGSDSKRAMIVSRFSPGYPRFAVASQSLQNCPGAGVVSSGDQQSNTEHMVGLWDLWGRVDLVTLLHWKPLIRPQEFFSSSSPHNCKQTSFKIS